jgi:hypothetical protein
LRVVHDVSVRHVGPCTFVCTGPVRALRGEEVVLELLGAGERLALHARVLESRIVPCDGSVRHELRLEAIDGASLVRPRDARQAARGEA